MATFKFFQLVFFLANAALLAHGWLCFSCSSSISEDDCNSSGSNINCHNSQHSCESTYSVDQTVWSKGCQDDDNCTSYCTDHTCVVCCVAVKCNAITTLVTTTTTGPQTAATTTTPSLPLSTGEQMVFMYIIFILVAPIVISTCAALCWLIYFRRKRRKREVEPSEDAKDTKQRKNKKKKTKANAKHTKSKPKSKDVSTSKKSDKRFLLKDFQGSDINPPLGRSVSVTQPPVSLPVAAFSNGERGGAADSMPVRRVVDVETGLLPLPPLSVDPGIGSKLPCQVPPLGQRKGHGGRGLGQGKITIAQLSPLGPDRRSTRGNGRLPFVLPALPQSLKRKMHADSTHLQEGPTVNTATHRHLLGANHVNNHLGVSSEETHVEDTVTSDVTDVKDNVTSDVTDVKDNVTSGVTDVIYVTSGGTDVKDNVTSDITGVNVTSDVSDDKNVTNDVTGVNVTSDVSDDKNVTNDVNNGNDVTSDVTDDRNITSDVNNVTSDVIAINNVTNDVTDVNNVTGDVTDANSVTTDGTDVNDETEGKESMSNDGNTKMQAVVENEPTGEDKRKNSSRTEAGTEAVQAESRAQLEAYLRKKKQDTYRNTRLY